MRSVEKLDVEYEEKRGVNNNFKRFGLSNWVNGGPLAEGRTLEKKQVGVGCGVGIRDEFE